MGKLLVRSSKVKHERFFYVIEKQWVYSSRVGAVDEVLEDMRYRAAIEMRKNSDSWSPLNFICRYLDIDVDFEVSRDNLGTLNILLGLDCSPAKKSEIVNRLFLRLEHEAKNILGDTAKEKSKTWNAVYFLQSIMIYVIDELLGTSLNDDEEDR